MLINLSNHPSDIWPEEQKRVARAQYAEVVDIPFPPVDPAADTEGIRLLAEEYLKKILQTGSPAEATVHVMGELSLTHTLVNMLKDAGYTCVASTSFRELCVEEVGKKTVIFKFVRFREY